MIKLQVGPLKVLRGFFLNFKKKFYLGVHSDVITCSPMKPGLECTKQFDCRDGSLPICPERHISNGR